jgi:hypothetical protein
VPSFEGTTHCSSPGNRLCRFNVVRVSVIDVFGSRSLRLVLFSFPRPPGPRQLLRSHRRSSCTAKCSTRIPVSRSDAFVELVSEDLRTFADSAGYFRFPDVGEGQHQVRVTQLGYVTLTEHSELLADEVLTIWLTPRPLELEGIVVTVNRLERRRRAFARSMRALDSKAVQTSGAFDALELLERIPGGRTIPCGLSDCVLSRGRYVPLRVVVDEMRTFGGAFALEGYPTSEIHSIEFIPSCSMVRVYTRHFIERMGRRGGRAFFTDLCSVF